MRRTKSFGRIDGLGLMLGLALAVTLALPTSAQEGPTAEADKLFAAGEWKAAATAYAKAAKADPSLGAAWFGLGTSSIRRQDYKAALPAYQRALELEHLPPWAMFGLARANAALGHQDRAIEWLLKMAETGINGVPAVTNTPETSALSEHPRYQEVLHALRACRSEEYRQFDFWLGDWDVTNQQSPAATPSPPPSHNRISSIQNGCAVLEEYDTPSGFTGISINFYDAAREEWHQSWMSNQGSAIRQSGGIRDGNMVLLDDPDGETINRTTWTPLDENRVRQHWELSNDGGKTWSTLFDGLYTRRKKAN